MPGDSHLPAGTGVVVGGGASMKGQSNINETERRWTRPAIAER